MIYQSESLSQSAYLEDRFSLTDTAETLTEVSVAALTTDPDLRGFGRALITLVRYYATKTTQD